MRARRCASSARAAAGCTAHLVDARRRDAAAWHERRRTRQPQRQAAHAQVLHGRRRALRRVLGRGLLRREHPEGSSSRSCSRAAAALRPRRLDGVRIAGCTASMRSSAAKPRPIRGGGAAAARGGAARGGARGGERRPESSRARLRRDTPARPPTLPRAFAVVEALLSFGAKDLSEEQPAESVARSPTPVGGRPPPPGRLRPHAADSPTRRRERAARRPPVAATSATSAERRQRSMVSPHRRRRDPNQSPLLGYRPPPTPLRRPRATPYRQAG